MIIIFDLDGTLSNMTHRLHFIKNEEKDWDAFFKNCIYDTPIKQTIKILQTLYEDHEIKIWTGRSEKVKKATEDWFNTNGVFHSELRMRPVGDYRKDHDLKAEWIDELLKTTPKEEIVVFEDRRRMVTMYRDRDIVCYHVDHGEF